MHMAQKATQPQHPNADIKETSSKRKTEPPSNDCRLVQVPSGVELLIQLPHRQPVPQV